MNDEPMSLRTAAYLAVGAVALALFGFAFGWWFFREVDYHQPGETFDVRTSMTITSTSVGLAIGLAITAASMRRWWKGQPDAPNVQVLHGAGFLIGAAIWWLVVYRAQSWHGAKLAFAVSGGGAIAAAVAEIIASLQWRARRLAVPRV